jgi:hypothetical protein
MPWPPVPSRGPARWPVVLMFAITLVAVAAAVAAWLRPMPETKSAAALTFGEQQVADAKAKVCAAYQKVRRANEANAARNGGDDPNVQLLVAVNERQIYVASSAYLLTTLGDEPATPSDLAVAVRKLADEYQVVTLNFLASDTSKQERDAADQAWSSIQSLCK